MTKYLILESTIDKNEAKEAIVELPEGAILLDIRMSSKLGVPAVAFLITPEDWRIATQTPEEYLAEQKKANEDRPNVG